MSSLIGLLVVLLVLGVIFYVVETLLPMPPSIKRVIEAVILIFLCIWLLRWAGMA